MSSAYLDKLNLIFSAYLLAIVILISISTLEVKNPPRMQQAKTSPTISSQEYELTNDGRP